MAPLVGLMIRSKVEQKLKLWLLTLRLNNEQHTTMKPIHHRTIGCLVRFLATFITFWFRLSIYITSLLPVIQEPSWLGVWREKKVSYYERDMSIGSSTSTFIMSAVFSSVCLSYWQMSQRTSGAQTRELIDCRTTFSIWERIRCAW